MENSIFSGKKEQKRVGIFVLWGKRRTQYEWKKDKYQADTFSDSEVSSIIRILSTLVQDRLIYAWKTEVFGYYHYISFVF